MGTFTLEHTGADRRCSLRVGHSYTVSFKAHNAAEVKWDISSTKNLSTTGALFLSNEAFSPESTLDIKLKLPTQKEQLLCKGKVKRCQSTIKKSFYTIAVNFIGIDSLHSAHLKRSLDFFLTRDKTV